MAATIPVEVGARRERVSLLAAEPEFARLLAADDLEAAAAELSAPAGVIEVGAWEPPDQPPAGADLGLLVFEGALVREVNAHGARGVELLGRGDLMRPWQEDSASFCDAYWRVLEPTRVAILDERFAAAAASWPAILTALVERALRRSRWLVVQSALSHLVGVEKRLLTILWHIGEKWGSRESDGIVIGVTLTHRLLAEMAGVGRAYVTGALGELVQAGQISRLPDGSFMLHGEPPEAEPEAGADDDPLVDESLL